MKDYYLVCYVGHSVPKYNWFKHSIIFALQFMHYHAELKIISLWEIYILLAWKLLIY